MSPLPPLPASQLIGPDEDGAIELLADTIIVDGQRQQVWVRVLADADGWHNALVFRRDGKLSPMEAWTTGLDWHLPPDEAFARARRMDQKEKLELYERALRPRPPLI